MLRAAGTKRVQISPASPWQNGVAERWIGSCRRELLGHVIILNDAHLRRLIRDYISYYHADRIHDSLEKDTPAMRSVSCKPGNLSIWFRPRALVVCITDMTGSRLLENVCFLQIVLG